MFPSPHSHVPLPALPPLVAAYVEATNSFDLEGLLVLFTDDALVNDQLRDHWGKQAIKEWAARDIIGERLTMQVVKIVEHYGHSMISEGCLIRWCWPSTSRPKAIRSFSSSFFAIGAISE